MSQFSIYANANASTKSMYPYLLNVQSALLDSLDTRMVIPLSLVSKFNDKSISNLTPIVSIKGSDYILLTAQMAGVHKKNLGSLILDLSSMRQTIISAIDFLITGF